MGDLRKNQGGIPVDITPSLSDLHRSLINDMLSPEFLGIEQVALLRAMDISVDAAQSYIADAIAEPDGAAQIGTASGNTVQQELDTRVNYSNLSASDGGGLVGFIQEGTGAVARTLLSKDRDIVHANDFGLVGDGTDETTLLQQAINAASGKVLMLGNGKTYGIGAGGITIPDKTTIISNGAKFKKLASSGTYGITVLGSFNCDHLLYETVGGTNDAGINIAASDVHIGKISATSLTPNTASLAPVNGLLIHKDDVTTLNRIWIGSINIVEWAAPMRTRNVDGIYLGPVTIDNFRTGYYCINTRNGIFVKGDVRGLSPTSVGGPGDNGVLLESTFDYATENLLFIGWHVEDSGEHAFRIGGQNVVRNIKYVGCSSTNTGAATGATGGAAFKVLHGNTNPTYHENIIVQGFTAIDCGADPAAANNNAAVQIGKVKGAQFSDFTIRKRNKTYSCRRGFQFIASEDIEINNPNITDAENFAFQFIQAGVVTPAYPTTMSRIHINGGQAHVSQNAAGAIVAKFEVGDGTFTDVSINGTTLSGGRIAVQHDNPTGAGAYVNCLVDCIYRAPLDTTGSPPFVNPNTILVRAISPKYGTFHAQGSDGSTMLDPATGITERRISGVWWNNGERYGTWTPSPVAVTNVDAAVTNGAWRWLRVGDTVQFSGSINIDNTAASALSEVGIDLPVPSNFTSFADASGTAVASSPNGLCGTVQADTTNDRLAIKWQAGSTVDNRAWFVTGSYTVK